MSVECPVCREPLPDRPERCFRCETPLSRWWDFEGALAQTGSTAPVAPPAARGRASKAPWIAAVIGGMALGAAAGWRLRGERTVRAVPVAAASAAPVSSPSAAPHTPARASIVAPRRVAYRVQRGDSLWRIAAALTGEGHRWRELWPERKHGRLTRNEVLLIPTE